MLDEIESVQPELVESIYKQIVDLTDENYYVPAKSTKYDILEPRYYKISAVLDSHRKWEYVSRRAGRTDGKIEPSELYKLCSEDPVLYLCFMKGLVPRPHQIKALEYMLKNKYLALCWGRRIGKSWVYRYFAEWSCIFNKHPVKGKGTKWSVIMHSKDVARDIYMEEMYLDIENGDITTYENFGGWLGDNFISQFMVTREDKTGQATGLKLSFRILRDMSYDSVIAYLKMNKSEVKKIRRYTSNFKIITAPRGIEGNVICDEVSFWKENNHLRDTHKVYYKGIEPIVTSQPNLKCFISSTPDGLADIFAELFDPLEKLKHNPYIKLWYPCWVITEPEFTHTMEQQRTRAIERGDLLTFQQEYEAKFVKAKDAFFDEDLHISRVQDDKLSFVTSSSAVCDISADWGGTNTSHTALAVTSPPTEDEPARLLYYHEYEINEDNTVVDDIVTLTHKFPNWRNFICDNKGGRFAVSDLKKLLGDWRVIEFNFSTQKKDGYFAFKQEIRNDRYKTPLCERIQEQMRNFTDKLKPNDAIISDDVMDATMMPCYYNSQATTEDFGIIDTSEIANRKSSRSRDLSESPSGVDFADKNAWGRGSYGKY